MGSRSAIKLVHIRISGADKYRKSTEELEEAEADSEGSETEENDQSASSSGSPATPPPQPPSPRTPFATRQQMSLDPHRASQVPGLTNLASWAFGPSGLQNLQVLAYGDFSYQGRYVEDTFVFGRNRSGNSSSGFMGENIGESGYNLLKKEERNDVVALYGDF